MMLVTRNEMKIIIHTLGLSGAQILNRRCSTVSSMFSGFCNTIPNGVVRNGVEKSTLFDRLEVMVIGPAAKAAL